MNAALYRRLALAAVLPPLLFAWVTLRTLSRGEAEIAASDRAFDAGELEPALRHARRAASSYVPGAAYVDAAYARLRALALDAERSRDLPLALRAWEAMRAAALDTRHVWTPHVRELELADANLGRLRAAPARALSPAEAPKPVWILLLGVGFCAALASLLRLGARAWTESGNWRPARAIGPALGWCAGLLVLGWALLHA